MKFLKKILSKKERRASPRYTVNMSVYTEEGYDYKEKLINVSETGCCFKTPVKFLKNDHIVLHFIASNSFCTVEESFCLNGNVVWNTQNKDDYLYGINFPESKNYFFNNEQKIFREHLKKNIQNNLAKKII